MRIMRYTGANTREVLARIRAELGPDAVILSNREVIGGVELMAAVDFDARYIQAEATPSPAAPAAAGPVPPSASAPRPASVASSTSTSVPAAPSRSSGPTLGRRAGFDSRPAGGEGPASPASEGGAAAGGQRVEVPSAMPAAAVRGELEALRADLRADLRAFQAWVESRMLQVLPGQAPASPVVQALEALGFERDFCAPLAQGAAHLDDALTRILGQLPLGCGVSAGASGVFALLGATGVGKTTTVAKLAARLVLAHGTDAVGLVTTDTYRIGGVEQLKIYGRILGVPVVVARNAEELDAHLQAFSTRRFVLIDTIGLSPRDRRLDEQLQWLSSLAPRVQRLLLLTAGMGRGFYDALWQIYGAHDVAGCILTKLDETPCFGAALQWLIEQQLPLWYYTDGQRVPEDLHEPAVDKIKALLGAGREAAPSPQAAGVSALQQRRHSA